MLTIADFSLETLALSEGETWPSPSNMEAIRFSDLKF